MIFGKDPCLSFVINAEFFTYSVNLHSVCVSQRLTRASGSPRRENSDRTLVSSRKPVIDRRRASIFRPLNIEFRPGEGRCGQNIDEPLVRWLRKTRSDAPRLPGHDLLEIVAEGNAAFARLGQQPFLNFRVQLECDRHACSLSE